MLFHVYVCSGMETGHSKEFQKMSTHLVSGAVRGPAMGEAGQVRRRSLAPSMSGGFSYEETSNVQEVKTNQFNLSLFSSLC